MQIRYLRNEEIDYEQWDNCIREAFNSRVYAYSWYLDCVCPEWGALIYGEYQIVMPLPEIKKFGISAFLQPLYCQQLGLFSSQMISAEQIESFLQATSSRSRIVKLMLNAENKSGSLQKKANYILPLISDYDILKQDFSSNCKRNIKKSQANSCTLMENLSITDIMDLFRWQVKEKKLELGEKHIQLFEKLVHVLIGKGTLLSVGVYSPVNHLCSYGLFIRDEKRVYYLHGASDAMGTEYKGLFRIIDHVIAKFAGNDYILDFEGSEIPGIARFFSGFGATNRPYPVFESFRMGLLNSMLRKKFS